MIRRRSRTDLLLARTIEIGQRWRHKDTNVVWRVSQIYRLDCEVVLRYQAVRQVVPFARLRTDFRLILDHRTGRSTA